VECHGYAHPDADGGGWDVSVTGKVPDPEEPNGFGTRAQYYHERDLQFAGREAFDLPSPEWRRGTESGDMVWLRLGLSTMDRSAAETVRRRLESDVRKLLPEPDIWARVDDSSEDHLDVYADIRSDLVGAHAMGKTLCCRWPVVFARVEDDGWPCDLYWQAPGLNVDGGGSRRGGVFVDPLVPYAWMWLQPWSSPKRRTVDGTEQWRRLRCDGQNEELRLSGGTGADEWLVMEFGLLEPPAGTPEMIARSVKRALGELADTVVVADASQETLRLVARSSAGAPRFMAGWPSERIDFHYDGRTAAVAWRRQYDRWTKQQTELIMPSVEWARLATSSTAAR